MSTLLEMPALNESLTFLHFRDLEAALTPWRSAGRLVRSYRIVVVRSRVNHTQPQVFFEGIEITIAV